VFGLTIADIIVIFLYFALIVGIGMWAARRIKNQEDYFLAGRRFGRLVQTFASFGQATSVDNAVGVTTTTFNNGIAGVWSSLQYLFATPLYWLVTHWPRRMRIFTMGDYFTERYHSRAMGAVYSLIGSVGMMALIALGFSAMSKTVMAIIPKEATQYSTAEQVRYKQAYAANQRTAAATGTLPDILSYAELMECISLEDRPGKELSTADTVRLAYLKTKRPALTVSYLSRESLVWGVCAVVLAYALLGGLEAAFLVDLVQGLFIIILSVLLLPFAWARINTLYGGHGVTSALKTIHRHLPEAFFQIFGAPQTPEFTWYYIGSISLMAAVTVVVQPNAAVLSGSAKDELSNRTGVVVGNFLKRVCTVLQAYLGLAAIVLYSNDVMHSDLVWGYATRDLLGSLPFGLVGLMIACLLAALMSTVDCYMITCSSLLIHNFYQPLLPRRSPKHYVWAGRSLGAGVVLISAWIALQFDTILQILKFVWEVNVMLAPAYWLGIKWRRANRTGAWCSIGMGALLFLIMPVLAPLLWPSMRTNARLLRTTHPAPRSVVQTAAIYDVTQRQIAMAEWQTRSLAGQDAGECPPPLVQGQTFTRQYTSPQRSIFWTQGLKVRPSGQIYGSGRFSVELWVLDTLGVPLQGNPYALNETWRVLFRTLLPFVIMIAASLLTRPDPAPVLDAFYAKMRTPVHPDRRIDAREVQRSLDDPHRLDHRLMFPNSSLELYRWTRRDTIGFILSLGGVGAVLSFVWVLVSLGRPS